MSALYITADKVGLLSGGGTVTAMELKRLRSLEPTILLDRDAVDPNYTDRDNPFVFDDLALKCLEPILADAKVKLAHFYAGTFGKTARRLKQAGVKIAYTCAAHDRHASIAEFERLMGSYPFAHIKEEPIWQRYIDGYRQADIVVVPSKHSEEVVRSYGGCENIVVIPHGVGPLPARPAPFPKKFRVGYFGALGPDKGVPYLLTAWKQLAYEDAVLLVGGRGSENVVSLARTFGGGNIQATGFVATLADFYNQVTVYVQPSVTEGFGIEILEAMAHGRPVICSVGAGGVDMVEDGVDGFRVPARDPAAIADKVRWCREHPTEVAAMGERAFLKASRFTWERILPEYEAVWAKLVGGWA
jgi:glycosyltransferase involved in cell wall biosynthesis